MTARIEGLRPCTQYTFRFLLDSFSLKETFSFAGWEAGTSTVRRRGLSPSTPRAPLHPPPPPRLHRHLHHRAPRLPSSSSSCSCSPASPSPPSSWSEVRSLCRTEWLSGRFLIHIAIETQNQFENQLRVSTSTLSQSFTPNPNELAETFSTGQRSNFATFTFTLIVNFVSPSILNNKNHHQICYKLMFCSPCLNQSPG